MYKCTRISFRGIYLIKEKIFEHLISVIFRMHTISDNFFILSLIKEIRNLRAVVLLNYNFAFPIMESRISALK